MSLQKIQKRLLTEYERVRLARLRKAERFTIADLLDASGLKMDRSTLHRKLHGDAALSVDEATAIGKVLGVRVSVSVRKAAA